MIVSLNEIVNGTPAPQLQCKGLELREVLDVLKRAGSGSVIEGFQQRLLAKGQSTIEQIELDEKILRNSGLICES